jgi:indole-3-glycerol phosphate synthase
MTPPDILVRIAERRRQRLAGERAPALAEGEPLSPADNAFLAALSGRRRSEVPAVIAEVKMGSPRLGSLHGKVDPVTQAQIYADNGAAALSVVVEPDFFHGGYDLLAICREASGLPAIAKDFVVDPVQLLWAKEAGADAVLLVAALYQSEELAGYARQARGLGLVPLIETHDADDVAKLVGEPWEIVGVNNRDLRTFEVDLQHSISLVPSLPHGAVRVAESGIHDALDLLMLRDSGFDAFLIGESLLLAPDPGAKLRELTGRP